jgi:hypothetical protein
MLHLSKIWKRCVCGIVVFLEMSAKTSFGATTDVDNATVRECMCPYEKSPDARHEALAVPTWKQIEKSTPNDVASDPYIQDFLYHYGSECVVYKNGNLILYADPSFNDFIYNAVVATVFGLLSILPIVGAFHGAHGDLEYKFAAAIMVPIFGFISVKAASRFLSDLSVKGKQVPYITLDSKGLILYETLRLFWETADHVETSVDVATRVNMARIVNKFGDGIFSMWDNDPFLPIPFDQLKALVRHYMAMYGKEAKAQKISS